MRNTLLEIGEIARNALGWIALEGSTPKGLRRWAGRLERRALRARSAKIRDRLLLAAAKLKRKAAVQEKYENVYGSNP